MNDMSSAVLLVGLRVAVCLRGVSMCEKERDGVCVCVCLREIEREATALGCWRHALPLLCRYVCDSCTQHASERVCVFIHACTLEGCLSGAPLLDCVCVCVSRYSHLPRFSLRYVCAAVHVAGECTCVRVCVCLVKYSNISVCCLCLPAALPL